MTSSKEEFKTLLKASLKSEDTEEKIDVVFFRPLGLRVALFAKKMGIKPNPITIFGIICGVAAGHLFYYESIWLNIAGILLLMCGSTMDSADGQLARMTNQCSRLGRILDGFGGYLWFVSIYLHLLLRFAPGYGSTLFYVLFVLGILSHSFQSAMADYYRNSHLLYVFGKGELDSSDNLKSQFHENKGNMSFIEKIFALFYINYTQEQEMLTRNLRKFKNFYFNKFNAVLPEKIKEEYRAFSKPLQKYCNGLTLNFRFYMIYITLLFNNIFIFLLFESIFQNLMLIQMVIRHEIGCRKLNKKIENELFA